ncbi:TVP38/TMEM64 family protein [Rhodomicrobium sp. Az07]|uniref:TVP38/TMEM64 family protein n=1 Tax=Rhodomicrobium sp. Az07 TaxID=2839034 RepID=UPI002036BD63|nr:TVP38/TMEM64 family protein [Rhodomicrobium sp. Az07]
MRLDAGRWLMRARLKDPLFWLALIAIGLALTVHVIGWPSFLTFTHLKAHRQEILAFVAQHYALSAAAYVALYIFVVAMSLPSAVLLTLTGGFLFGAVAGTILTVIGATTGAALVFLLARALAGDTLIDRFGATGQKLVYEIRANAWSYLLVLRLVPVFPFFLVNIVPAFAGVRLATFVLTTFFGIMPGTAVYSMSGAGLGSILDSGETISFSAIMTPEILGALIGLAVLSLAMIPIRRRFSRAAEKKQACKPDETHPVREHSH